MYIIIYDIQSILYMHLPNNYRRETETTTHQRSND